jgi:hypothetical protein
LPQRAVDKSKIVLVSFRFETARTVTKRIEPSRNVPKRAETRIKVRELAVLTRSQIIGHN